MTLTPRFQFGRIRGVISASFSFSRGSSPSVCSITVPAEAQFDRAPKPMIWSDGQRSMTFTNCIVCDVAAPVAEDGFKTMVISIWDRRWKWRFSQISGRYNVRSGGVVLKDTKKTVRELAELCLKELGEKNYDVKQMPNDTFPHIDWDLLPVTSALDQLCQLVNCHVTLSEKDTVVIYPEGFGKDLPNLPNTSRGIAYDFGAVPGKIGITSASAKWQLDFDLIPVGLDTDGEIKPIDKLSYVPEDKVRNRKTWAYASHPFIGVKPGDSESVSTRARKLAQETVWKWFLIVPPGWRIEQDEGRKYIVGKSQGLTEMPGLKEKIKILSARQFFPLLDHQLEYDNVSASDRLRLSDGSLDEKQRARKPPQVYGYFYDESLRGSDNFEPDLEDDSDLHDKYEHLLYQKSFRVDNDRGILIFSDPVFRFKKNADPKQPDERVPPDIRLRVAANFHSHETRAAYRVFKTIDVKGAPDPKLTTWSGREDTILEIIARHDLEEGKTKFNPNDTNSTDVDERLNFYLSYAIKKYETKTPAQAKYPFLVPFAPDGLIAQVNYEIGGSGVMSTSIHKVREEISNLPTYDERRQALQLKSTIDQLSKNAGSQDVKKDGK